MLSTFFAAALLLTRLAAALPVDTSPGLDILEFDTLETRNAGPESSSAVESRAVFDCRSGVRVFAVRGTGSPMDGNIYQLALQVAGPLTDSFASNLPYPATDAYGSYGTSESKGVAMLSKRIRDYVDACPYHKVAIMGFSQGAQVVGDTLIGPSGTTGGGLEEKYRSAIRAVVVMGDPAFVPGKSFDVGTARNGGLGKRTNVDMYAEYGYTDKMRSYCTANDYVCDSGNSAVVHQSYFAQYGTAAVAFAGFKLA